MRAIIPLAVFQVFVIMGIGCITNNSYQATDSAEIKAVSGGAKIVQERKDTKIQSEIDAKITGINKGDTNDVKNIRGGSQ